MSEDTRRNLSDRTESLEDETGENFSSKKDKADKSSRGGRILPWILQDNDDFDE